MLSGVVLVGSAQLSSAAAEVSIFPRLLAGLGMIFALWVVSVLIMIFRDWWGFRRDLKLDAHESHRRWERRLRMWAAEDRRRAASQAGVLEPKEINGDAPSGEEPHETGRLA